MFDKLVESTKQRRGAGSGRFFFLTSVIYVAALLAIAVGTIFTFSPALAEQFDLLSKLTPPPPSGPQPPVIQRIQNTQIVQRAFASPVTPPTRVLPPSEASNYERVNIGMVIAGMPPGPGEGSLIPGISSGKPDSDTPLPPPPARPTPEPRPTPEQKPDKPLRVSSNVLQGTALRKVQPPYPVIAKQVRAQGAVQIQINISESGAVTEATVIGGHPLLRDAALQAARQWVFRPTELNGVPVKVVGVITFNFTLN